MNSGASTMPTKTLAAVDRPTAPPTPIARRSAQEMPRTIAGRTPQWNSNVVSALITSTMGSACSASTNDAPGNFSSKGRDPPPR